MVDDTGDETGRAFDRTAFIGGVIVIALVLLGWSVFTMPPKIKKKYSTWKTNVFRWRTNISMSDNAKITLNLHNQKNAEGRLL